VENQKVNSWDTETAEDPDKKKSTKKNSPQPDNPVTARSTEHFFTASFPT
jgi:hypothetical protein